MSMRILLALVLMLVFATSAFGKHRLHAPDVEVHQVTTADRQIILVVSGPCRFWLPSPEPDVAPPTIETRLVNAVIVLDRAIAPTGADQKSWDANWETQRETAEKLRGQRAYLDVADPEITIRLAAIQLVRSERFSLRLLAEPEGEDDD